jgi:hypothetical protein
MSSQIRNGNRWSVNEILSLQREFELLGWNIDLIAQKHKRTPQSIMYKLSQEGFADYNDLYCEYHKSESEPVSQNLKSDEDITLSSRVSSLESSLSDTNQLLSVLTLFTKFIVLKIKSTL